MRLERAAQSGAGLGNFFEHGVRFLLTIRGAWSIASVSPTNIPVLSQRLCLRPGHRCECIRVLGNQHFPSDVVVGGAIGWLIGRQIYRAHHDAEVEEEVGKPLRERRRRRTIGIPSTWDLPSVPLDSWVYSCARTRASMRSSFTPMNLAIDDPQYATSQKPTTPSYQGKRGRSMCWGSRCLRRLVPGRLPTSPPTSASYARDKICSQ